ncbi:class I SAM-dependent methyltransferase [Candidatus Falkowbacteria bacterium]|nr:class I SAM-dependent methyltransferase [Candidatus Falkowbacteria bacterium]MBT7007214.1 class I SAM-dependent methyltransferase [Candidatus Falkowbacteria bacterium]
MIKQNKNSYDQTAKMFSSSRRYVWPDLLVFQNYIKEGDKLLDLGCGNGRLVDLVKDLKVDYLGVDNSQGLIDCAAKSFPDKNFQVQDALNLDLAENSFDAVLCVSVLNHIEKENQQQFIENIKKVLKPDGVLLLSNWNMWNIKGKKSVWKQDKSAGLKRTSYKDVWTIWKSTDNKVPLYYYAFTKRELNKLLRQNGFKIIKSYYTKKGKKTNMFHAENIITVAKLY